MKKNRIFAALLSVVMCLGIISGCGENKNNSNSNNAIKGSEADLSYKVSDKKLNLSFFYCTGVIYDEEMPVFKEAERLTNVRLEGTLPDTTTDYYMAVNTAMASGKLPDIMTLEKKEIDKYAGVGAFIPLDDLIDEHAPNIKKYLDANPEIKNALRSHDGHIYSLPRIESGDTAKGWYIRKDWLDKLGLEEPKTVDEFYNVLKAFKTQDPNGNGKADEIPYFDRAQDISAIYNLFGVRNGFYVDEATDTIKHGMYIDEYKNAIKNAAKWYKEGLIDQEVFTRGSTSRDQLLGNNTGGVTHDWFTSTSAYTEKLASTVPGIEFAAIAPPADINGEVWEDTKRGFTGGIGWAITKSNKYPIETIKYFDFWFTDTGLRLYNYGVEGNEYTMVDGKPTFTKEFINTDKSMTNLWWEHGINVYIGSVQDFDGERQFMTEQAKKDMDIYIENEYMKDSTPVLSFTEEETDKISTVYTALQSFMSEQEQKWIMNTENVDDNFDEYMANCKRMGMEDILKVYNDAYARSYK